MILPKDSIDRSQKILGQEGLLNEVLSPRVQSIFSRESCRGRYHDDGGERCGQIGSKTLENRQAASAGHLQIEKDQVGFPLSGHGKRHYCVGCQERFVPGDPQNTVDHHGDVQVVFYDQDLLWSHAHCDILTVRKRKKPAFEDAVFQSSVENWVEMTEQALEAMQTWLMELGNEGRSPRTIEAYEHDVTDTLRSVAGQVGADPKSLPLSKIKRDHLVAAVADFRVRRDPRFTRRPDRAPKERSPARVARRLAAVRVFFKWCYSTGRIPSDPAALLKSPKKAKRLPKALEPEAAARVMDGSIEDARWPERDQLIVVLALTTGLRLEEMATLKMADISGNPPSTITVIGKGNKERRLPLPPVTQEALALYLPTRSMRLKKFELDASTLFISSRPRPTGSRPRPTGPEGRSVGQRNDGSGQMTVEATRAGIAYVVDRVLRRMGARRPGSRVHVLRHTFATLGLRPDSESGQPAYTLRQLQAALGHASLSTIQVYTEVTDAELMRAASAHPLAKKTLGHNYPTEAPSS